MRKLAIATGAALVLGAGLLSAWLASELHVHAVRGSSTREYDATTPRPRRRAAGAWSTYGFDLQRTHSAPFRLRPPFRRVWSVYGDDSFVEYPPVVRGGLLVFGTNAGSVVAVDAVSGRVRWRRRLGGCVASSPALAAGLVFVGTMAPPPCTADVPSGLFALDTRTGGTRWTIRTRPVESSPLVVGRLLVFGSWDGGVYAVDAHSGRLRWRFITDGRVKSGAAFAGGSVFIGSDDGHVYALAARTGVLRWRAAAERRLGPRGRFYATPAVAYGRVFVGATDGVVYAFGAGTGHLLWARPIGPYVYSAAAVSLRRVFVGSYDHHLYALDAGTGDVLWRRRGAGPVSGAPTVIAGLVYFSTCGACSSFESNARARRTYAVDARTGAVVWRFPDGEYSPVIADRARLYLTGYTRIYALRPLRHGG